MIRLVICSFNFPTGIFPVNESPKNQAATKWTLFSLYIDSVATSKM